MKRAKPTPISSAYRVNGRPFLQIDMGGSWITVDLGAIKEKVDKRLIDLGLMSQDEIDRETEKSRIFGMAP